jgi:hypothetical protein
MQVGDRVFGDGFDVRIEVAVIGLLADNQIVLEPPLNVAMGNTRCDIFDLLVW